MITTCCNVTLPNLTRSFLLQFPLRPLEGGKETIPQVRHNPYYMHKCTSADIIVYMYTQTVLSEKRLASLCFYTLKTMNEVHTPISYHHIVIATAHSRETYIWRSDFNRRSHELLCGSVFSLHWTRSFKGYSMRLVHKVAK